MGFNNPAMPWKELEARLSGRRPPAPDEALERREAGEADRYREAGGKDHRGPNGRAPGSPSWNAGGDGPAWSRKRQPYEPPDHLQGGDPDLTPSRGLNARYVPYAALHCHSH